MKSFVQIKSRSDLKVGFSDKELKKNRKQKQRYERMLKNLDAKEDDGSLFLYNFNPMIDRKTKRQRRRPRRKVVEERINTKDKDMEQASEESDAEKHSMDPIPTAEKPSVYDNMGVLLQTGLDLCDCLEDLCPGCHFPCPNCGSSKCGHVCRSGRKWQYSSVMLDGFPNSNLLNMHLGSMSA